MPRSLCRFRWEIHEEFRKYGVPPISWDTQIVFFFVKKVGGRTKWKIVEGTQETAYEWSGCDKYSVNICKLSFGLVHPGCPHANVWLIFASSRRVGRMWEILYDAFRCQVWLWVKVGEGSKTSSFHCTQDSTA